MKHLTKLMLLLAVLTLALTGCGGGGGGGGTSSSGGSNGGNGGGETIRTLVGTTANPLYDRVFVLVKRVELVGAAGNRVVYNDPVGHLVTAFGPQSRKRARTRADDPFSYELLGAAAGSGTYTGVKVTVSPNATFVPVSGGSFQASFPGATGTEAVLSLNFAAARTLASGTDFAAGLDVANWTASSGNVIASSTGSLLAEASFAGSLNQQGAIYTGTISNLSGSSFALSTGGVTVPVAINLNGLATTIYADDAGNGSLQNGQTVTVSGTYDPDAKTVAATTVRIVRNGAPITILGVANLADESGSTLSVDVFRGAGFLPSNVTVTAQTVGDTRYFGVEGTALSRDDFYAQFGGLVEIEGRLNGDTIQVSAIRISQD